MKDIITSAASFFWKGLLYTLGFLLILIFGVVGAVLFALPWLLRAASVLTWLAAGYLAITGINTFYRQYVSSPIPVLVLQFAIIIAMVGWVTTGFLQRKNKNMVWGMFATGGILIGGFFWKLAPWLFNRWPLATDLIFRILPSALFMVLLVATTLRLKWLRTNEAVSKSVPAFVWLKKQASSDRNTDTNLEVEGIEQ